VDSNGSLARSAGEVKSASEAKISQEEKLYPWETCESE